VCFRLLSAAAARCRIIPAPTARAAAASVAGSGTGLLYTVPESEEIGIACPSSVMLSSVTEYEPEPDSDCPSTVPVPAFR
jgi:hypothetical protein